MPTTSIESAEQHSGLDHVFKLFQVPTTWFRREGVLVILIRIQTSATKIEMAFLGKASLALCGLDPGSASWPLSLNGLVESIPGLDWIQMFFGSSMTCVFQS
jgi:hypothetical protein